MSIILMGLNHKTAPVELRETLYLTDARIQTALTDLTRRGSASGGRLLECIILSTCNRLEIYAVATDAESAFDDVAHFLANLHDISVQHLRSHLYCHVDEAAIDHLMKVSAGLDSLVLGETQILGQVAHAFEVAQNATATGAVLSHLFSQVLHAGKRVRNETAISSNSTSISHTAAQLIRNQFAPEERAETRVLLVGAGEMSLLAGKTLYDYGFTTIHCVNRTYPRAEMLVEQFGGQAYSWRELWDALAWADVVVTATSAPHVIIYAEDILRVLPERSGRPLMFVDVAVPRNVDDSVSHINGMTCYNIDHLQATVDDNMAQREAAIAEVCVLLAEESDCFMKWLHSREVVPVIVDLRSQAQAIASAELELALNRLDTLSENEQKVIAKMAHRIVNKLLHQPTACLREHAENGDGYEYANTIRELFGLNHVEGTAQKQNAHG